MLGLSVVLTPAGVEGLGWVWASVAFPSQLHIALVLPLFQFMSKRQLPVHLRQFCNLHGEVLAWQSHCAALQSSYARKGVLREQSNLGSITLAGCATCLVQCWWAR